MVRGRIDRSNSSANLVATTGRSRTRLREPSTTRFGGAGTAWPNSVGRAATALSGLHEFGDAISVVGGVGVGGGAVAAGGAAAGAPVDQLVALLAVVVDGDRYE